MNDIHIVPAGDSALVLRLGDRIDPATNAQALAVAGELRNAGDPAIGDLVVGYASVTVYFDPLAIDPRAIEERLRQAALTKRGGQAPSANLITIPVRYGGVDGPDLGEVAAYGSCSEEEVIALHSGREYRVFMLGFLPGFPYMGIVDDRIAMPRRDTPRLAVPAGSVGLAGQQTGVYPVESPGGWRLIGRTSVTLFDPSAGEPTLLHPGDLVRFARIS